MALKGTFSERVDRLFEERGKEGRKVTIRDLLAIATSEEDRQSGKFLNSNFRICWAFNNNQTSREFAEASSYLRFKRL